MRGGRGMDISAGSLHYNRGHDSGNSVMRRECSAAIDVVNGACCLVDLDDIVRDGLSCKRQGPRRGRCTSPRDDRHIGDNPFRRFRQFCKIVQFDSRKLRLWSQRYARGVGSGPRRWSRRKAHSDRVEPGLSIGADCGVPVHTGPAPEPCGVEKESTAQEGRGCEAWE